MLYSQSTTILRATLVVGAGLRRRAGTGTGMSRGKAGLRGARDRMLRAMRDLPVSVLDLIRGFPALMYAIPPPHPISLP